MRSAIDRDADPQQMIPKLTCVLLKLVRPSFRNSSNCALGVQMKLCSLSPWQKDDVYRGSTWLATSQKMTSKPSVRRYLATATPRTRRGVRRIRGQLGRARCRRAVARAVRPPRPSRISKARTPTAPAMVLVAYPADRKPFPVESGIWLTRDYAATS